MAENYQRIEEIEHILKRSMFAGATDRLEREVIVYDGSVLRRGTVSTAEGQVQLFLEILGNSADNVQRSRKEGIDPGKITVTIDAKTVKVRNEGKPIPIVEHPQGGYVPELIFGELRTSSNYDDTQERTLIGTNGYGAKLANIFSSRFKVDCADGKNRFVCTWKKNMSQKSTPKITETEKSYVEISYDVEHFRFGVEENDSEFVAICYALCAEVAYTCSVPIIINGHKFNIPSIKDLVKLFYPNVKPSEMIIHKEESGGRAGKHELCLVDTPDDGHIVSFVNGVIVANGGVQVNCAYAIVTEKIKDYLSKHLDGIRVGPKDIEQHVSIFMSSWIDKPILEGQTKSFLKGPKVSLSLPESLDRVKKWGIVKKLMEIAQARQMNMMKKTDGKSRGPVNVSKLEDANFAGKKNKEKAKLICIEGDSASEYAVTFVSQMKKGRDIYGILPFHGKMLNVLNADFLKIMENRDFIALKKALGLQEGKDYSLANERKNLRYGGLLMFPDADNDGKHIFGLLLVYFMSRFPSLIESGYIQFMRTPIIRVMKGKVVHRFYTLLQYEEWSKTVDVMKWKHSYFKGLGTSTKSDIQEDFKNQVIVTMRMDEEAQTRIVEAFKREKVETRKQWLEEFMDRESIALHDIEDLGVSTFIEYELFDYTLESIVRSIPEMMDGFKESQRKVIFASLRKLATKEKMKTAQIASHAAEVTCYKHGETSLAKATSAIASVYPGGNNIGLLVGEGQFATRHKGPEGGSNPRYTFVSLPKFISKIFRPEDKILEKLIVDEGETQECENFFPIVPLHVINGVLGIGTAYSTTIPAHNPIDVANWIIHELDVIDGLEEENTSTLAPWYKNYKGVITEMDSSSYITQGVWKKEGKVWLITELPLGIWNQKYLEHLKKLQEDGKISNIVNYSDNDKVYFQITETQELTEGDLRLTRRLSKKNMTVLYRGEHPDETIKISEEAKKARYPIPITYDNINDLMRDFVKIRLRKYLERVHLQKAQEKATLEKIEARRRFVQDVISKKIKIMDRPIADVLNDMNEMNHDEDLLDSVKTREYTRDGLNKIDEKISKIHDHIEYLEKTPVTQIWVDELKEFINVMIEQGY